MDIDDDGEPYGTWWLWSSKIESGYQNVLGEGTKMLWVWQ